jgi:tryptophanyl-tRNA synthetase
MSSKHTVFSGVQPSGKLTIANYIGAISQWIPMIEEDHCIFCLVDLHALTVPQEPDELRERFLEFFSLYIACGLDPEKCILFVQSHVPEHAECAWVLNCVSTMGELNRMTQFKDKTAKAKSISTGLFTYPLLMAADILLYDTHKVPVGEDQKQHVELCRDLAERFNQRHTDLFVIPDPVIPKTGGRVMSLQDPTNKMSKSDPNPKTYVALLDPIDTVVKKIRKAVTDSGETIEYTNEKPAIRNLIEIHAAMGNMTIEEVVAQYEGKRYGDFKSGLADCVVDVLEPIQARYHEIRQDPGELERIMADGAARAQAIAGPKMKQIYDALGLVTL